MSVGPGRAALATASLFTVVPLPMVEVDRAVAAAAIKGFPWLGLAIGAAAGLVATGFAAAGAGSLLPVAVGLALTHAVTGAMHLDGLADVADGLGSRAPAPRAIEIMKKSDIGPMGVAAIVLVLLVGLAALASPKIAGAPAGLLGALAVGPMIGRLQALAGTRQGVPPAHPGGFAGLLAGATSGRALALSAALAWGIALLLGFAVGGARGLLAYGLGVVLAAVVGFAWERVLRARFGGLTGDCWGSLSETSQLTFWLTLAVAL